jgi:predicted RND superfamily exporter protein
VLVEYQSRCRRDEAKIDTLVAVYRELLGPLFLASVTTVIGMLSLTVSRVQGIREFGAFAGLGVVAAFVWTATFLPIALSYLPAPVSRPQQGSSSTSSARTLVWLHRLTMRHPRAIIAVAAVAVALAGVASSQIRAESTFVKIFKQSNPVRLATERIQDVFGGTVTMDVLIDTRREDGVTDSTAVLAIADLEAFLRAQPDVTSTQSLAGYLKALRRAVFDNDAGEYRLPRTREEAAQYLLLYDMEAPDGEIRDLVTLDHRQTRVTARVKMESSKTAVALVERTRQYLRAHFPGDIDAEVSGVIVLIGHMHEYIRNSLVQGFGSAFVLIFAVFCLQMRSVRLGAIVMSANLAPVMLTLGYMGATGIRLDAMTALVASVAIGLTDDASIHFVSRVRSRLSSGCEIDAALHEALVEVGRALVFSGLTLCAGFAVLLSASFSGAVYFGWLTMMTIALALASDLILLPALLRWDASRARRG